MVCRAFRKPSPNHRQAFEPWNNHAYYLRDNSNFRPSEPSQIDHNPNFQYPFASQQPDYGNINSNNNFLDLPQLDSPTISTSLATKEATALQLQHQNLISEDCEEEKCSNNIIDWQNLDSLLESQFTVPYQNSNTPLTPQLEAQGNVNVAHILGFLHDS